MPLITAALITLVMGCSSDRTTVHTRPDASLDIGKIERATPPAPKPEINFGTLPEATPSPSKYEDFVGAAVCVECHKEKGDAWADSVHGQAGGVPSPKTVVPPFNGRPLRFSDGRIIPEIDTGRYVFRIEKNGVPPERYTIDGVVGRGLLHGGGGQTFLSRRQNGSLVPLPLEYNVTGKRWYCQLLGENAGWTPVDGSFSLEACGWPPGRSMGFAPGASCGNCHGSQIDLRFDESKGRFETRVRDLAINCESCHGPGRRHVQLMQSEIKPDSGDIGLRSLDLLDTQASVDVCMACHANKANISGGYLAGGPLHEHMTLLSIWDPTERKDHFDGRLVNFGYQQGHLYSPCYTDGSMTCVDCHDPHTLKYRDIFGKELPGRFDDGQCVDCHPAKVGSSHAQHTPGTEGARCTSCHMPYHQLSTVGSVLPHARSDHAIPIPRPQHDARLGINGACNRCHKEQGLVWQSEAVKRMYGTVKPLDPLVNGLFKQFTGWTRPRGTDISVRDAEALVAQHARPEAIVSLQALSLLIGEALAAGRATLGAEAMAGLLRLMESPEIDLRGAAAATILVFAPNPSDALESVHRALTASAKDGPALRRKVVYNLIGMDYAFSRVDPSARRRLRTVMETHGLALADGTQGLAAAIGASYMASQQFTNAITYFDRAKDSPAFKKSPYSMNIIGPRPAVLELLADAQGSAGQIQAARATLTKAMELNTSDPRLRQRVCDQLSASGQLKDAERCLKKLIRLDPSRAATYFRRAQLLEKTGRLREALEVVEAGLKRTPDDPEAEAYRQKLRMRLGR